MTENIDCKRLHYVTLHCVTVDLLSHVRLSDDIVYLTELCSVVIDRIHSFAIKASQIVFLFKLLFTPKVGIEVCFCSITLLLSLDRFVDLLPNRVIIISLKIDLCYLSYVQRSIANCLRDSILLYFSVFTYWIIKITAMYNDSNSVRNLSPLH